MSNNRVRVGILGATGMVGQRFVQMLEHHPEFEITALAASDRSQGKTYGEACTWRLVGDMPVFVKSMVVQPPQPPLDCDVVVSSLPSDVARSSEEAFARAGYPVISNASSFRMDEDVPILIPEINADHLRVLDRQKSERGFSTGYIVTNPNCSTIIMALALAPLHAKFGIEAVIATTLQAVSGAGYPGVPSLDVVDNVLPFIDGEEPKMESETRKILGRLGNNSFENAPFPVITDGKLRVVKLAAGSNEQTMLPFTGLKWPGGVAVDGAGNVVVSDENYRILELPAGSSEQTVRSMGGLSGPFVVDSAGDLYFTDDLNRQVWKRPAGSNDSTALPFKGLNGPNAVAVDGAGNVYVLDRSGFGQVVKLVLG